MNYSSRLSNIELLRLLLMFMILNLHSWRPDVSWDMSLYGWFDGFREASSVPAVTTFVLISGFFSIKWNAKKFIGFLYQILFFIIVVHFVCFLTGLPKVPEGGVIPALTHVGKTYWFVDVYVVLLLFAPMTNSFFDSLSSKQLLGIVFFLLVCAWMSVLLGSQQFRGNCPESFLIFYAIGRLLRKYYDEGLFTSVSAFLLVVLYILISITNMLLYVLVETRYSVGAMVFGYETPFVIIQSCILLILFFKYEIKSKIINYISSSAIAIYLLHMHYDVKEWYYNFTSDLYETTLITHIQNLLLLFLAISILAVVIDKIRELSYKLLSKIIIKYQYIDEKKNCHYS